jgi:hypothetical protein
VEIYVNKRRRAWSIYMSETVSSKAGNDAILCYVPCYSKTSCIIKQHSDSAPTYELLKKKHEIILPYWRVWARLNLTTRLHHNLFLSHKITISFFVSSCLLLRKQLGFGQLCFEMQQSIISRKKIALRENANVHCRFHNSQPLETVLEPDEFNLIKNFLLL